MPSGSFLCGSFAAIGRRPPTADMLVTLEAGAEAAAEHRTRTHRRMPRPGIAIFCTHRSARGGDPALSGSGVLERWPSSAVPRTSTSRPRARCADGVAALLLHRVRTDNRTSQPKARSQDASAHCLPLDHHLAVGDRRHTRAAHRGGQSSACLLCPQPHMMIRTKRPGVSVRIMCRRLARGAMRSSLVSARFRSVLASRAGAG